MIRIAVLGCGRIGQFHARTIHAHPRAELAACYDIVPDAARSVAAELGVTAARSVEAVLADPGVDAVLIASSTDTHVDLITKSVLAGKAVLCEKPIDLDILRVDACWREIGEKNPLLLIGFNRRYDPSFKSLRDRLTAGEIGKLEQVIITSRDPSPPPAKYAAVSGGIFRDMTIHDFDMARYLAGDIVEVQAFGANLIDPEIGAAGDFDAVMVTMRAAGGALVHINNSRRCVYGYDQRIEVFGARGMLQAHNRHVTTVESWGAQGTHAGDPVQDFFIARYTEAYQAEIAHFVDCFEGLVEKPIAGFGEGRQALLLANAALESAKTGHAVRLAP